nr:MAG TPA: hypothetical protein [Caudoviricetes sp.]
MVAPPYFLDFFFSSFSRFFACSSKNSLSNREMRQKSSSESVKRSHSTRRASYLIGSGIPAHVSSPAPCWRRNAHRSTAISERGESG